MGTRREEGGGRMGGAYCIMRNVRRCRRRRRRSGADNQRGRLCARWWCPVSAGERASAPTVPDHVIRGDTCRFWWWLAGWRRSGRPAMRSSKGVVAGNRPYLVYIILFSISYNCSFGACIRLRVCVPRFGAWLIQLQKPLSLVRVSFN